MGTSYQGGSHIFSGKKMGDQTVTLEQKSGGENLYAPPRSTSQLRLLKKCGAMLCTKTAVLDLPTVSETKAENRSAE